MKRCCKFACLSFIDLREMSTCDTGVLLPRYTSQLIQLNSANSAPPPKGACDIFLFLCCFFGCVYVCVFFRMTRYKYFQNEYCRRFKEELVEVGCIVSHPTK